MSFSDEVAKAFETLSKTLYNASVSFDDFYKSYLNFVNYKFISPRIRHLSLYHRKARVRKKNQHRIDKILRNGVK